MESYGMNLMEEMSITYFLKETQVMIRKNLW